MGEIIRQERRSSREKEEDKVCSLHSDFVTAERSGAGEKKTLLITVVISIKTVVFLFPKVKVKATA